VSFTHSLKEETRVQRLADRIRRHVAEVYVRPAREAAQPSVRVRAGDVHRALNLNNQVPAVCGAIDSRKCLEVIGASSVRRTGPHQSTTAEWEFELAETADGPAEPEPIAAVWEGGCFRPLTPPHLIEGQRVTLIVGSDEVPARGGRFAAFAGTLSPEEAQDMQQELQREFGRIEGEW
jgi:hypothetical protein